MGNAPAFFAWLIGGLVVGIVYRAITKRNRSRLPDWMVPFEFNGEAPLTGYAARRIILSCLGLIIGFACLIWGAIEYFGR